MAVLVAFLFCAAPSAAKEKASPPAYALLVGSVFSELGRSLAGIEVTIRRSEDQKPKWRAVSDRRGEFAVRLPAEPAAYLVSTRSRDYQDQDQTIEVRGEDRISLFLRLKPRAKDKKDKP